MTRRLLWAVLIALLVPATLLVGASVETGTVIAAMLGLLVVLPPLVLVWGETRGTPSVWGWTPLDTMDADLRRLLDEG